MIANPREPSCDSKAATALDIILTVEALHALPAIKAFRNNVNDVLLRSVCRHTNPHDEDGLTRAFCLAFGRNITLPGINDHDLLSRLKNSKRVLYGDRPYHHHKRRPPRQDRQARQQEAAEREAMVAVAWGRMSLAIVDAFHSRSMPDRGFAAALALAGGSSGSGSGSSVPSLPSSIFLEASLELSIKSNFPWPTP